MTIVQLIKTIDFKNLPSLLGLALSYPLFVIPTLLATRKTMKIAQKEYGNAHKGDTKANAFRHALWNVLIVKACLQWKQDLEKVLQWTEKITAKHEKLAPNPELQRAMDLHNNRIGISLSPQLVKLQDHAIITALKKRAEKAQKINRVAQIENLNGDLVYLT